MLFHGHRFAGGLGNDPRWRLFPELGWDDAFNQQCQLLGRERAVGFAKGQQGVANLKRRRVHHAEGVGGDTTSPLPVGSVLVVVRSGILAHTLPIAIVDAPVSINQDLRAFHCPAEVVSRISSIAASKGIALEIADETDEGESVGRYIFRRHLGRIEGRRRAANGGCPVWLTFPRSHAFNPLLWMFDFRLSSRIERMFQEVGARRCDVSQLLDT
jgi:hypothetical protein